jgi:hypothetical protein
MSWGANHCASELDLGAGPVRFWGTCLRDVYQRGGSWEAAFCGGGPAHWAGLVCCSSEKVFHALKAGRLEEIHKTCDVPCIVF